MRLRFRHSRRDLGPELRIDGPLQLHPGGGDFRALAGEGLVAGGLERVEKRGAAGGAGFAGYICLLLTFRSS